MRRVDLTGQVFGRWKVAGFVGTKNGQATWTCRCSCGSEKTVSSYVLRSGKSVSCGCYRVEHGRAHGARINLRHGEGGNGKETPEYRAWAQMLTRCENVNHPQYPDYGGRGIAVCERWHLYENFLADMGRRPPTDAERGRYSIDRKNNEQGYAPENCRWATYAEQNNNNKRPRGKFPRRRQVTIGERTQPLEAWLAETETNRTTFYQRVARGMTVEAALITKPMKCNGQPLTP